MNFFSDESLSVNAISFQINEIDDFWGSSSIIFWLLLYHIAKLCAYQNQHIFWNRSNSLWRYFSFCLFALQFSQHLKSLVSTKSKHYFFVVCNLLCQHLLSLLLAYTSVVRCSPRQLKKVLERWRAEKSCFDRKLKYTKIHKTQYGFMRNLAFAWFYRQLFRSLRPHFQ